MYIYRAGLCDSDDVYYSMLCEGCLEEAASGREADVLFNALDPLRQLHDF